jgi:hypothetical protein
MGAKQTFCGVPDKILARIEQVFPCPGYYPGQNDVSNIAIISLFANLPLKE